MNAAEYANLDRVEAHHWYYSGKRELVTRWIHRARRLLPSDRLLDYGAGTGRFALELGRLCQVWVLDEQEEALRLLRSRFPAECILRLKSGRVPLPDGSLDVITALDVLEHTPDDAAVVRDFHRLLAPGGLAVVTVPAGMELWSDWDVQLHHLRRYRKEQLRALFPDEVWELVYHNHTNVLPYPVVRLVRSWRRRFRAREHAVTVRVEDRVPHRGLNRLLKWVFVRMAHMRVQFPFGVSQILVARRR